jgi:hypothetical protein
MSAMLPFKWYLCYATCRLAVDIRLIIPTLSSLVMLDREVMHATSSLCSLCTWVHACHQQ